MQWGNSQGCLGARVGWLIRRITCLSLLRKTNVPIDCRLGRCCCTPPSVLPCSAVWSSACLPARQPFASSAHSARIVCGPRPLPQVIIAYLLGSVLFHNPITALGLAGTALIACGVIVVNLEKLLAVAASKGGSSSGSSGSQPLTEQPEGPPPAAWWHRLLPKSDEEPPPLKAKRSDLEAELGRLPGPAERQHHYQPLGR